VRLATLRAPGTTLALRWIYEEKYDGCRMVTYKDGTHVQLVSRPHRSWLPASRPDGPKPVVDLIRTRRYSRRPFYFCVHQRGRHMNSTLQQKISGKMSDGLLPTHAPLRSIAGFGSGSVCHGCDEPVLGSEVEHDHDFDGNRRFRLHSACEDIWRTLRDQLMDPWAEVGPARQPPGQGVHPALS